MPAPTSPPGLLTPEAAAQRLSISRTRAFDMIARGELDSIKIGRNRRVFARSVDDWINAHDPRGGEEGGA